MSTYTTNYNLEKPDSGDDFKDFRANYNSNMDIIDANLGQGGGGGSDVSWNQLQVTGDKIATIRISGIDTSVYSPNSQTFTMAISRANINSDEKYSTIFGKIKKWFNDLKTVAFSGSYNDLSDQPNIPTATSDLNNDSDFVSDASYVHTDNNFTNADVTKLSGIQSGAEVNVQSDWNEADNTADDYIKNKPTIPTNTSDLNNDNGFLDSSDITVTQVVSSGTKIATIDVDGTSTDLYAPTSGGGSVNDVTVNGSSVVNAQGVAEVIAVQDNPTFTEAQTRANIVSGESFATILGKIKKFFSDLKTVAFTGSYNDLSNKPTIPVGSDYVQKSGDTMTGELEIRRATGVDAQFRSTNTTNGYQISFGWGSGGTNRGIWDTQFAKWIFRSTGTDVTVNGSTVPANKTLASTDQIPTDFVSKSSGGTFTGIVNVQTSNQTPLRNKTTASNADCYLEFSNGDGYLGWFAVSAGKKPCFQSASDNVLRELATTSDLSRLANYYSSRPSSANIQLGDGTARYFLATSSMSTGKPTEGDAHLLHLAWDNSGGWDGQLALPTTDSKHMQWRTQTNGTWGAWKTIIDSDGGTITGGELYIGSGGSFKVDNVINIYEPATGNSVYLRKPNAVTTTRNISLPNKDGTIALTSDISSRRYKENIIPLSEDEAKKILDVEIVNYDYKENVVDEDERYDQKGAIAEDVAELIPNAVTYADIDGEQLPDGINYTKFIPYLIKMVQMQQKEIDELKAMIKEVSK